MAVVCYSTVLCYIVIVLWLGTECNQKIPLPFPQDKDAMLSSLVEIGSGSRDYIYS